jgi:hypothetical protein
LSFCMLSGTDTWLYTVRGSKADKNGVLKQLKDSHSTHHLLSGLLLLLSKTLALLFPKLLASLISKRASLNRTVSYASLTRLIEPAAVASSRTSTFLAVML